MKDGVGFEARGEEDVGRHGVREVRLDQGPGHSGAGRPIPQLGLEGGLEASGRLGPVEDAH